MFSLSINSSNNKTNFNYQIKDYDNNHIKSLYNNYFSYGVLYISNYMIFIGGKSYTSKNTIYIYDTLSQKGHLSNVLLPSKNRLMGCVLLKDRIYLIGGNVAKDIVWSLSIYSLFAVEFRINKKTFCNVSV